MVTMWLKRQQTKNKFWSKNEFIEISFGQNFKNSHPLEGWTAAWLNAYLLAKLFCDMISFFFFTICFDLEI
jgi:NADH:ubiquinone oxidoreductase subunit 5 (subunit L)/multisubunit Na+/H+ antiporter MnhA subunit